MSSSTTYTATRSLDSTVLMEWAGMLTGLFGSLLLAFNGSQAGWGFALYLASNVLWILAGTRRRVWAMVAMMGCYSLVSAYGIYNWLIVSN